MDKMIAVLDRNDWRSDASIAYAILRLTLGVNIGFPASSASRTAAAFAGHRQRWSPRFSPRRHLCVCATLIWVESAVGLMLILGLKTRLALCRRAG
jgi:uncharacterized membrane protein YphA (DoxX/SURF4 family)